MFSESHNDKHRRIGDADPTGIGVNSAEIGDDTAGIVDIAVKVIPC